MIYNSCGSMCQKKCFDNDKECNSDECVEGCFCPNGLVLNESGRCIKQEQCSCKENGMIYLNGQVFEKEGCQKW